MRPKLEELLKLHRNRYRIQDMRPAQAGDLRKDVTDRIREMTNPAPGSDTPELDAMRELAYWLGERSKEAE